MKRCLIILLCCFLPLVAMAQMRITGTVTDMKGDPLTGVIIQVRSNSTNKMIRFGKTDAKGVFSLEAAANSYLEVSMLGFKKQRIDNLSNEKPLRIVMQEEAVALKYMTHDVGIKTKEPLRLRQSRKREVTLLAEIAYLCTGKQESRTPNVLTIQFKV